MTQRVVQQVGDGARVQRAFHPRARIAFHAQGHAGIFHDHVHELSGLGGFLAQRDFHQVARRFAAVGAGQKQHRVDDVAQPFQLFQVGLQRGLKRIGRTRAGQGHLGLADHVAQRRAQFVGDVGIERVELLVGALQPIQCLVERDHQAFQLGRQVVGRQAQGEVAHVQLARVGAEPVHRRQAAPGDPPAQRGHRGHGHQRQHHDAHRQQPLGRLDVALALGHDQLHRRALTGGRQGMGQGQVLLAVGQHRVAEALDVAVEPRLVQKAAAHAVARIAAFHQEVQAAVLGGEVGQLVAENAPLRVLVGPCRQALDDHQPGVEFLTVVALQFVGLEQEQRDGQHRQHHRGGQAEHQPQPCRDGAGVHSAWSSRTSST